MAKILVTREIPGPGIEMLKNKGYELDIFEKDRPITQKELLKRVKKNKYDGVLSLLTDPIDAEFLDAAPSVKIVSNYAVGYNNIDVDEAKKRGVMVTNTSGSSSECVAEHTVALIFALAARVVEGDDFIRRGKFTGWSPTLLMGEDIRGKVLGLIGAGNIGEKVALTLCEGLGMKVVYHDIVQNDVLEKECGAKFYQNIEDVLRDADIVSLHVPLLESTRHLLNKERISMMKPTAYLINTSRGAVVDEMALVEALYEKRIKGAGLDVFEFEPKLTKGLTKLSNVVLTPHIASARMSARIAMSKMAAQNIIDFFDGKVPVGCVIQSMKSAVPVSRTEIKV